MDVPGLKFRLAPMCRVFRIASALLLALPLAFAILGLRYQVVLLWTAALLAAGYAWVWLRMRPSAFVVQPDRLEVLWPLRRESLPRGAITGARVVAGRDLKAELGWAMRVGAGGLWGGFGWLYTQRRGKVRMYISRIDRLVWIEVRDGRPWLITPDDPDAFVSRLSA